MCKIIVCNQKMFLTYDDAKELSDSLKKYNDENLIVCPNFINMDLYSDFNVCAQNCHYENEGAYTGEVSAYHLKLKGVKYVLLGHSERRDIDTDLIINKKVMNAVKNNLVPILCVGETLSERSLNKTSEILRKQLNTGLKNVNKISNIIVAYEPRWLIGGTNVLTISEIKDTYEYISKVLKQIGMQNYKILYGGSVTDENIKDIMLDELDGYLIGSACTNIDKLDKIIKCIKM